MAEIESYLPYLAAVGALAIVYFIGWSFGRRRPIDLKEAEKENIQFDFEAIRIKATAIAKNAAEIAEAAARAKKNVGQTTFSAAEAQTQELLALPAAEPKLDESRARGN